ncbi:MAG: hypothetical protein ABI605_00540 [Rhizobacter sp.]
MWHWNSLWAHAPGDPPAIDDPALWQSPWSVEQAVALQARSWETMVSATHSWWSVLLSAWPMPKWPTPGWVAPQLDPVAATGIEPLAAKPPALRKATTQGKRSTTPQVRHAIQARKR